MNETHRGCRSPGGFFFALVPAVLRLLRALVFVVGAVLRWASVNGGLWVPLSGAIYGGRLFPPFVGSLGCRPGGPLPGVFDCLWCSRLLQTGSSYDDAINRRSFTPVRL
jgi:hypothetical protein